MLGRVVKRLVSWGGMVSLCACVSDLAPQKTDVAPHARPAALPVSDVPQGRGDAVVGSARSMALASYYKRREADSLARGLLRVDGGGPDTRFTDEMLLRNFQNIALKEEYQRDRGLQQAAPGQTSAIKKWVKPVRMVVETGASVSPEQARKDRRNVARYAARLSRLTGLPISQVTRGGNFHVMFLSADEMDQVAPRILSLVPNADRSALRIFDTLPRETQCIVIAFASTSSEYAYDAAIAVIRSEHPDLMRQACIHEEIAQGLGLADDSPYARPSIFNDDDEFALLTSHDELLLKLLYDPALKPGMTSEIAMPIVRKKAAALLRDGAI